MMTVILVLHEISVVWGVAIWRACWQGTLALLLAWGICRVWRRMPPNWRCWCWRLAYAKFALSLLLVTPIALPLLPPATPTPPAPTLPATLSILEDSPVPVVQPPQQASLTFTRKYLPRAASPAKDGRQNFSEVSVSTNNVAVPASLSPVASLSSTRYAGEEQDLMLANDALLAKSVSSLPTETVAVPPLELAEITPNNLGYIATDDRSPIVISNPGTAEITTELTKTPPQSLPVVPAQRAIRRDVTSRFTPQAAHAPVTNPLPVSVGFSSPTVEASNVTPPHRPFPWQHYLPGLFIAWLLGMLWGGWRLARSWRLTRKLLQECRVVDNATLLREYTGLCRQFRLSHPPDLLQSESHGPMLVGIRKQSIVLPATMVSNYNRQEIRLVLLHELTHLRHGDLGWNCLLALVEMCFFFNPLLRICRHEWQLAQEMACDASVVTTPGRPLVAYGRMLLKVATMTPSFSNELSLNFTESYHNLRRRILFMTTNSAYPRPRLLVVSALLIVTAIFLLLPWRLVAQGTGKATSTPPSPLVQAIKNGNAEAVKTLLEKDPAQLASLDASARTPLHQAALRGDLTVLTAILAMKDVAVNLKDRDGDTPLHLAVLQGDAPSSKALLAKGASADLRNMYGATPLHLATSGEVVDQLLNGKTVDEKKALLASRDNEGRTPLAWAAGLGLQQVVKALLDQGADMQARDDAGMSPLFFSVMSGAEAVKILLATDARPVSSELRTALEAQALKVDKLDLLTFLLGKGADVKLRDARGHTPLHLAASAGAAVVKLLVDKGADIAALDDLGRTPIFGAACFSNDVLLYYQEKNVNVTIIDTRGYSLLHQAASAGNVDCVKTLLAAKLEVNARSKNGETPLHLAAASGSLEVVKLLLAAGAKIESKTNEGKTAPMIAYQQGHRDVAEYLAKALMPAAGGDLTQLPDTAWGDVAAIQQALENGLDLNAPQKSKLIAGMKPYPLQLAAKAGNVDVVQLMLENGADPDAKDALERTPLFYARDINVMQALIGAGADVNARDRVGNNVATETAFGDKERMQLLLDNGLDVNIKSRMNRSLLHWSLLVGANIDMLQFCIAKGVPLDEKDVFGNTALASAVSSFGGSIQAVKLLLEAGADPNIKCYNGKTVLEIAQGMKNAEMIKLLQEAGAK